MSEWFLETTQDADVSICIVLNQMREYKIGRRKGYDIVSPNPLVSRNHGVITVKQEGIFVKDLGSANGTYINDLAIKPETDVLLKKDDLLGIGAPSNAIEKKKEIFWVRCIPKPRIAASVVLLNEADSTSIDEQDKAKNLEAANSASKEVEAPKINKDREKGVVLDDDNVLNNVVNKKSNSFSNNINVSDNVKIINDNNLDDRIAKENYLSKESSEKKDITSTEFHTSDKIKKITNDFPSSSLNATVNSDLKDKDISKIKKSFGDLAKSLSKTNENSTIPEAKLDVDYLNSLIEKRKKRKSTTEMIICFSSDEEVNTKHDESSNKNSGTSDKIINVDDDENDDIFDERINIKSEPTNHSFTQNDYDEIVIVSDDDDEIFPRSQIFGDIDVKVKREPVEYETTTTTDNCASPVSDNNDNNHDNIFSELVKNEIPEYDYNDNDEDAFDDDDCNIWYSKLSQSQDFISSSQKRKLQASPEPPDVVEQDDFPKFDDIDDIDFDKRQDEDLKESRSSPVVPHINENDEQLKSKDVEPELDDTTDSRLTDKISSTSSSSKLLSTDEKEEEKSARNKLETKKSYTKPPVIDAPFLIKGKRKAREDAKSKEASSSILKRRKSSHDDIPPVSAPVKTIQSSVLNIDKSVKDELDKRHKNKKRRKSTEYFTRNEKQKIQEDRKKKLKELASKNTESKDKKNEVQKSHHTKPKVKVSNSRGLFLTGVEPKQVSERKKKSDAQLEELALKKTYKIPKRPDLVSCEPSTSKTRSSSDPNISKTMKLPVNNNEKEIVEPSKSTTKEPTLKRLNKLSFNHLEQEPIEKSRRLSVSSNNNVHYNSNKSNGILMLSDKNRNSGKRVRFIEEPEIRYIERIPGNICRKVNSKDAPVPVMQNNIRDEDHILSIMLEWHPAWLEEQKLQKGSPQVSRRPPVTMLTEFNSFHDYCDIVKPLMLLELWRCIFRDWCYNNAPVKLACIDNVHPKPNGLYILCSCYAVRDSDNYFRNGDLLVAEFYLDDKNSKTSTIKKFGYVYNVYKKRLVSSDIICKDIVDTGAPPQYKIIVTLLIKTLQQKILQDKLMRVRLVSRIAPQLRIFKSVSNLQNSPLCESFILKPDIQKYKITNQIQMKSAIEDKLNNEQMMCVYEAYQICTRNEPGIYLMQGPPGTGKSYVIKNLIYQLLCDARNKNLPKCRILLCAPSNGAVDEIAKTLLDMRSKMSKTGRFKMIRLGPPTSISDARVKSISVQTLVENHLATKQNNILKTNPCMSDEYNFLIKKENTIKNTIMFMEPSNANYSLEVQKLRKVQESLERLKTNANSFQERKKEEKDSEILIIEGAQIICTTLSSCIGSKLEELVTEKKIEFTCCIVDEATQSGEPETLIPLLLGINKLILVGDPEQLPPTIISQESKELGHGHSLFSRIQRCLEHLPDNPIRMLTEQYRMHPEICKFPSKQFYGGRLKTAEVISSRTERVLDPCRLFCLNSSIDYKENEYLNKTEANLVLLLTDIVVRKTKYNVGIITPYTKQKDYLVSKYSDMRAKENNEKEDERHQLRVVINTVDGFQGQERDVIIISSVRFKSNIFLNDLQRLNVALTRAKHAVFICAHANLFKTDSIWKKIEADAKSRNFFYALTEKDAKDERYMSELIIRH